jgi:hypothetical protein
MAKVLPIAGAPDAVLLGYALGKAKAMEAGIIDFQRKIKNSDGTVQFRQDADGRVTAFVSGGSYAASFSNIMVPSEVTTTKGLARSGGAITYDGTFLPSPDAAGYLRLHESVFAVSPYSKQFIRKSQFYKGNELGKYGNTYLNYVGASGPLEKLNLAIDGEQVYYYIGKVQNICAANRVVLASIERRNTKSGTEQDSTLIGSSFISLRILSGSGENQKYRVIKVAEQPFSIQYTEKLFGESSTYLNRLDRTSIATNRGTPSTSNRSFQSAESVQTAPNGSTFVLREKNYTTTADQYQTNFTAPGDEYPRQIGAHQETAVRSMTLSFVAPDDAVTENIFSHDLGAHGALISVIPSADGKHVFVYFALHDDALEPKPQEAYISGNIQTGDNRTFVPLKYKEYLAIIAITTTTTNGVKKYEFSKATIKDLGPVSLREIYEYGKYVKTIPQSIVIASDMKAFRLYGASLEVGGYIWANEHCFNIAKNEFYHFDPANYETRGETADRFYYFDGFDRNVSTRNQLFDYLVVAIGGRSAAYYSLAAYSASYYHLGVDQEGKTVVVQDQIIDIPGTFQRIKYQYDDFTRTSDIESLLAETIVFPKPTA